MCLLLEDRVLTGDALLIGGTGRTDLPTGDPAALYESLFGKLLNLGDGLLVFPAHDYKGRNHSTLGDEKATNPRLQKKDRGEFIELMRSLDIAMPKHLTEALRTNRSGGKTVKQLIGEAARQIVFMSMEEALHHVEKADRGLVVLDVRERDAFQKGHLAGAQNIPRGELELRADAELPDPTARILTYCQFGKVSTLAASTLRAMGYTRAAALDGGFDAWIARGLPRRDERPDLLRSLHARNHPEQRLLRVAEHHHRVRARRRARSRCPRSRGSCCASGRCTDSRQLDVEDRHAVDGALGVLLGGGVHDVVGADDEHRVGAREVVVDVVEIEELVVGDVGLGEEHVHVPRHAPGDRVNRVLHRRALRSRAPPRDRAPRAAPARRPCRSPG